MAFTETNKNLMDSTSGYAPVNGLKMYYEIHGKGAPLVLIHGGGSTIETSFGRVLHSFAKKRQVIALELQGHGRTADIDRPETFEQDADDVAALLNYLKIANADFFGFSNGANTTMQIAMRHPGLVRKMILGSAFFKRDGMQPQFWDAMKNVTFKDMPQQLQEAYKKIAPNPNDLVKMFEKDKDRMVSFKDWMPADIQGINVPALIISGDEDVVRPEHAVELYRLLPQAKLAILPGAHGEYIGEIETKQDSNFIAATILVIEKFLDDLEGTTETVKPFL